MMILYHAIKTIQNKVFVIFENKLLLLFNETQKRFIKNSRVVFVKKRVFLNPDYLSILFCDFPLIARSGTSHVTISLIGCAPHHWTKSPW